ncbi:hypothetical protein B0H13DRAFT_2051232 [Mycena leptocephala]|nr:hypothetical protein B0H13DRAFT_2051232 [Mycena leptocephala]
MAIALRWPRPLPKLSCSLKIVVNLAAAALSIGSVVSTLPKSTRASICLSCFQREIARRYRALVKRGSRKSASVALISALCGCCSLSSTKAKFER